MEMQIKTSGKGTGAEHRTTHRETADSETSVVPRVCGEVSEERRDEMESAAGRKRTGRAGTVVGGEAGGEKGRGECECAEHKTGDKL